MCYICGCIRCCCCRENQHYSTKYDDYDTSPSRYSNYNKDDFFKEAEKVFGYGIDREAPPWKY